MDADFGDFVAVSSGSLNKPKPSHTKKGRAEFGSGMFNEADAQKRVFLVRRRPVRSITRYDAHL